MSRGAREISSAIAAGGEYGAMRSEAMERAVFEVECDDADAFALVHEEVKGKVLDEEIGVMFQRLAIEGVQDRVTGPIGCSRTSIGLSAFAKFERLASKGTLIDLSIGGTREWHAEMFELDDGIRCLFAHLRFHVSNQSYRPA